MTSWSLQQGFSHCPLLLRERTEEYLLYAYPSGCGRSEKSCGSRAGSKRAVIAGGGFIGLEVAENLMSRGIRTTVIDMAPHIMPGFDPEMAGYVEDYLADNGIMAMTNTRLEGVEGTESVEKVKTSRRAIKADALIMSLESVPTQRSWREQAWRWRRTIPFW